MNDIVKEKERGEKKSLAKRAIELDSLFVSVR